MYTYFQIRPKYVKYLYVNWELTYFKVHLALDIFESMWYEQRGKSRKILFYM
jgi:hypothetical protein